MQAEHVDGIPSVRIGVGLVTAELPPESGRRFADEYADTLRIAEHAEQLGFDSIWTSEHHGVSDGYLPSQLVLLSAIAAVTERIRLGTAVVVAPVHDPLRLAEDAAVLDHISDGRLSLGVGLGWRPEEYRMFGGGAGNRVSRLVDTVDVLRKAFTGERFSHNGRAYSCDAVQVTPRPLQPGGPRILVGGFVPEAVRRAGRLGDGFIRSRRNDPEALSQDIHLALEGVRESQRNPDEFEFVLLMNVGLDDGGSPALTSRIRAGLAYQLGVYAALHDDDDTPGHGFRPRPIEPETVDAAALWGTPQEVSARLTEQVLSTRPGRRCELVPRLSYPGMELSDSMRLLRTFAREVVPRVHEALAEIAEHADPREYQ